MEENREILVSIIIPVYQAKDTLDRCVLSCLNQKFVKEGELEVILVDDGSTDGSSDICDRLAKEDEHGRVQVDAARPGDAQGGGNAGDDLRELRIHDALPRKRLRPARAAPGMIPIR